MKNYYNAEYQKQYRIKNKLKIKEYMRTWNELNREKVNKASNIYRGKRRKNDASFRIIESLRSRLKNALKRKQKTGSAIRDLGCSSYELKLYLESLFKSGMSWDNYGCKPTNWSIDHIIPLSSVDLTNPEDFAKVNHYTNLQPLWHVDNIRKGKKVPEQN